jgi:hypothetical protein
LVAIELTYLTNFNNKPFKKFKEGKMKKLSIILLALAIAATMAVPVVMAGDVSMDGAYMLRGRADDNDGDTNNYFQHELDLNVNVKSGDVTFHWDIELADKDLFDGTGLSFDRTDTADDLPKGIWDGFYVKWQATDALAFQAGIYGVSDNNTLMFYSAGNGDGIMGLMYKLEGWNIAGYLSKQVDAAEDDETEMILKASGDLGPAAVSFMYGNRVNDATPADDDSAAIYADVDVMAGPVGVNFAYGGLSGDTAGDGGNIMILHLGLEELVGFDLGVTTIITNEDWAGTTFGNDYGYGELEDYDDAPDQQMVGLEAGYSVNDNLSLNGLVVVMNDLGDAGDGPTEFDAGLKYKMADNVTYKAGYATRAANDTSADKTRLWHRIDFKF